MFGAIPNHWLFDRALEKVARNFVRNVLPLKDKKLAKEEVREVTSSVANIPFIPDFFILDFPELLHPTVDVIFPPHDSNVPYYLNNQLIESLETVMKYVDIPYVKMVLNMYLMELKFQVDVMKNEMCNSEKQDSGSFVEHKHPDLRNESSWLQNIE